MKNNKHKKTYPYHVIRFKLKKTNEKEKFLKEISSEEGENILPVETQLDKNFSGFLSETI